MWKYWVNFSCGKRSITNEIQISKTGLISSHLRGEDTVFLCRSHAVSLPQCPLQVVSISLSSFNFPLHIQSSPSIKNTSLSKHLLKATCSFTVKPGIEIADTQSNFTYSSLFTPQPIASWLPARCSLESPFSKMTEDLVTKFRKISSYCVWTLWPLIQLSFSLATSFPPFSTIPLFLFISPE